jgi:hypothetical protein
MIEDSYIIVDSDGKQVTVKYFEGLELVEGPAIFPARYASDAAIQAYMETQFGPTRKLSIHQASQIQGFLGPPWTPHQLRFYWKDTEAR